MGEVVQDRISTVIDGNPDSIQNFVANGGGLELFVWLGLIYLKLHLKDKRTERSSTDGIRAG